MALFISIFATLILAIGVFGVTSPEGIVSILSIFGKEPGFWAAMLIRIAFGAALWRVAPASRTPAVLMALGITITASGLALPLIGFDRYRAMLAWWTRRPSLVLQAYAAALAALGTFLLWSVR